MGEVIEFPGSDWSKAPVAVDSVLEGAKGKLEQVLVIGLGKDGQVYAATSTPDTRIWVYMCQQFQHKLFNGDFG